MLAPIVVRDGSVRSNVDGVVTFGKDTGTRRRVIVTPESNGVAQPGRAQTFLVPKDSVLTVHAGDRVSKGQSLTPSNRAQKAGFTALEAAKLNDEPTFDRLVDVKRMSVVRTAEQEQSRRASRERQEADRARRDEEARKARWEAAADGASESSATDDAKKRARKLIAGAETSSSSGDGTSTSTDKAASGRSGSGASGPFRTR